MKDFKPKHYKRLAEQIKQESAVTGARQFVCKTIADLFKKDNPEFNTVQFYKQCNLPDIT